MFKKILTAAFILFLFFNRAAGFSLKDNLTAEPELSFTGLYADGSLKGFTPDEPYKSTAATLNLPAWLILANNIYLEANYFVRKDNNKNLSIDDRLTYNFTKANITYAKDNLFFKAGRQNYIQENKEFAIYYGDYSNKDNRLPSALDGISHGAEADFFRYNIIAAREVKKLSIYYDNSIVYGASLTMRPASFLDIDTFYYHRDTDITEASQNLALYGAGLNIKIKEYISAAFYAAFNSGTEKGTTQNSLLDKNFNGYAFNANIKINSESNLAKSRYIFTVYYGSPETSNSKAFTPISQNTDLGFIVGGSGILSYNYFPGSLNLHHPDDVNNLPALLVYSFKIDIIPNIVRNTYLTAGIYNFMSSNKGHAYRDAGSEIDLALGYKNSYLDLRLDYGLFISGNGLASITRSNAETNKTINKIGMTASFKFSL